MKKLLFASLAVSGLLGLTGCRSTDRAESATTVPQKISQQLDSGGPFYMVADQTGVMRTVLKTLDDVEAAVKTSAYPADKKAAIAKGIQIGRRVINRLGLEGEIGMGASSVAFTLPDRPEVMYRNRFVSYHRSQNPGILWSISGTANRDLSADMGVLPNNTLLAVDFLLHPDQLIELFREVEAEITGGGPSLLNPQIEGIIRSISGNWGLLITDDGDNACPVGVMLVIPDKDAQVYNLVASLLGQAPIDPAQPDAAGELVIPDFGTGLNINPVVHYLKDAVAVYSSASLVDSLATAEPLASNPDFKLLKHQLPQQGLGFLYTGSGIGEMLSGLVSLTGVEVPIDIPSQLLVWEKTATGTVATQNSRWDINHWQICMQFAPAAIMMLQPLSELIMDGTFDIEDDEEDGSDLLSAAQDVAVRAQMALIGASLQEYAAKNNGKFPAGADIDGIKELLKTTDLDAAMLQVPPPGDDELAVEADDLTYDRCSFIYFGGSSTAANPTLPLLVDWPYSGRKSFNVLFVNGDQATFEVENLDSCRRLVSFLQSRFKYSEADLNRLLATADKLDKLFSF